MNPAQSGFAMLDSRSPEAAMMVAPRICPANFTLGFSEYTSSMAPTHTMVSSPHITPAWLMARSVPWM